MAEYILRDDAIKAITALSTPYVECLANPYYGAVKAVKSVPAGDVRPVVHGHWIETYGDSWTCSECGVDSYVDEDWHNADDKAYKMYFCHYCGAKMTKEKI